MCLDNGWPRVHVGRRIQWQAVPPRQQQLGLGDTAIHEQPVKVVGLAGKGVRKLCGGECHALAMVKDGEVYSWGAGNMGQLGLGETANTNEPRLVPGLKGMTDIAAGG